MTLDTPLTEILGIEHPVLLAPMGNVSGGRLAAAVTHAGGLGLLGGGYGEHDWLERELDAAGDARIGVGFITWSLARQPDLLSFVLAREPAAVMLSFGDPAPFAAEIRDAGATLICQVQSVSGARAAVMAGADIVVAQGREAGGYGARRSTFALVPAAVDAVYPVPVVAAGGVADGRGLAAALMLGAAGVLVGTRLFAATEALGHDNAKSRIVESAGDDTLRTTVFDIVRKLDWPEPFTGRAIANAFTDRWHGREEALEDALAREHRRYSKAARAGDFDTAVVFAGEAIDLIDDVEPAAEIVGRIIGEAEDLIQRRGRPRR